MGAFICQLSETDWLVSREIGVYGNREGSDRTGKIVYFTKTPKGDEIIQSIIEDLIGMRKGDTVLFHVIDTSERESTIHGVYRVREEPFYDNTEKIWESSPHFIYPYRFCFEPHPDHMELCKYDASILVSEFYRSIENRDIRSVLTLEREVRGAAHAVKKITVEDAEVIAKLLYRDFHSRHIEEPVVFQPKQLRMSPLRTHIQRIGEIEFAIKALVTYQLGQKKPELTEFIPACRTGQYDFLIESFIGQTMRKPTDILCISSDSEKAVTIVEAKTDQAAMNDLVQSIKYQELFKLRNIDKDSLTYQMSICLLAQRFHQELVHYAFVRNIFVPSEETILLKYTPSQNGKDATFAPQTLLKPVLILPRTYPEIRIADLHGEASSNPNKLYATLSKKTAPKTGIEFGFSDRNVITLAKFYLYHGKRIPLGLVLVYETPGKCDAEDFIKFMSCLRKEARNFRGDMMSIEPVIIARDYGALVDFFIEKYNKYEIHAGRLPISAYILSQNTK